MKYINIQEAAKQWGVSPRRVQQLCKNGAIEGAVKEGRSWRIPAQAQSPAGVKAVERPRALSLPVGISGYVEAVTRYYYIDKTLLIRDFIDALPNSEIFSPWSVINYVDENCYPKAFWQSTGSNEIIGDIIASATPEITENLRRLMQGKIVTTYMDTGMIYPEVKKNPASIYSFLLVAGYLRCAEIIPQNDGSFICRVSIPNRDIALVYAKEIISRLPSECGESTAATIQQAIFEQNAEALQKHISAYLMETISVYDTGSEAFYQGLMIGLCAILNNRYTVRSNHESGLGRFDIPLCPLEKSLPGFIFELKASKKDTESLEKLSADTLRQIDEKSYETEMRAAGIREIVKISMAFRGKDILVKTE